jgi:hypothetical protein
LPQAFRIEEVVASAGGKIVDRHDGVTAREKNIYPRPSNRLGPSRR